MVVKKRETMTSGSVNVYQIQFTFNDDWIGLEKRVVFRVGDVSESCALDDTHICEIPSRLLKNSGQYLYAGVYGTMGEDVILPTAWANCGLIAEGVKLPSMPSDGEHGNGIVSDHIDRIVVLDYDAYASLTHKDGRTLYLIRG